MKKKEEKWEKIECPSKAFPKIFITWRVYWISKYYCKIKHFEFASHSEAYKMMCLFLKNKKCSWIQKNEKVFFISCNHPMWDP